MFRNVLVGVNAADGRDAIALATRLVAKHGRLTRVHVFHARAAGRVDRAVAGARARIAALGGVEPHAAYGAPVEELTLYSASLDLLVVGSRGYGPIGRLVHGSTAQHRHAPRAPRFWC